MKNQWPFWLFVIAILIVVVIAMNYQGAQDVAPLGDIFSQGQGALEYEYVAPSDQKTTVAVAPKMTGTTAVDNSKVETKVVAASTATVSPVSAPVSAVVSSAAATSTLSTTAPVKETAVSAAGSFAVQILSSKDEKATEAELQKVKKNGFAEAYIRKVDLGGKGIWYRIYVGQYTSMTQAQEGLTAVKQKYPQAFISKF
jgi:cell division septation protein DedD